MELSLPETFEAYSDARKAGFLKIKTAKEGGRRVAGTFCTFTPLEILDAAVEGNWNTAADALQKHLEIARDKAEGVIKVIRLW